jgi:hypothetical protein
MRTPRAHQSTDLPWPLDWMISGARYSGVPQRVQVRSSTILAKPKSVILTCPAELIRRFSGLRSR